MDKGNTALLVLNWECDGWPWWMFFMVSSRLYLLAVSLFLSSTERFTTTDTCDKILYHWVIPLRPIPIPK